jgi:RimJ/RimL family protein N-acetyltransferase
VTTREGSQRPEDRFHRHFEETGALIELKGPSLLLRYVRLEDAPRILELLRDPEVSRFFLWEPPRDLEETQQYVQGFQHEVYRGWAHHFAVVRDGSAELLGIANLYRIDRLAREAEIGIWLGRRYWGQGVQREVNGLLLDFGFDTLQLERVRFRVAAENARAQAAFRKLGVRSRGRISLLSQREDRMVEHLVYELEAARWRSADGI